VALLLLSLSPNLQFDERNHTKQDSTREFLPLWQAADETPALFSSFHLEMDPGSNSSKKGAPHLEFSTTAMARN
jgi:hypothetical protein